MIKYLNLIIKYLCALFLAIMVVLVVANTVLRYVFSTSIIQTEELCRYLFMWVIYLSVIAVWEQKGHICVSLVADRLGGAASKIMKVAVSLMCLFALLVLLWGSVLYFNETTMIGQVTKIPYRMMILPVMIASAACSLLVLSDLRKTLFNNSGKAPGGN
jgi:TRAP-type C4-dicarboxylate transport system permease small subunit